MKRILTPLLWPKNNKWQLSYLLMAGALFICLFCLPEPAHKSFTSSPILKLSASDLLPVLDPASPDNVRWLFPKAPSFALQAGKYYVVFADVTEGAPLYISLTHSGGIIEKPLWVGGRPDEAHLETVIHNKTAIANARIEVYSPAPTGKPGLANLQIEELDPLYYVVRDVTKIVRAILLTILFVYLAWLVANLDWRYRQPKPLNPDAPPDLIGQAIKYIQNPSRLRSKIQWSILWLALGFSVFYVAVYYSSAARPIWTDEFLHYALGSYSEADEAWSVTRKSIIFVNHGQTGFHMMIDYAMAKIFGASAIALRLPGTIATVGLLFLGLLILRRVKVGAPWLFVYLLFNFLNDPISGYFGEARPYILLAFSSVGAIYYYLIPFSERRWFHNLTGLACLLIGVLGHPYFCVYWAAAFGFGALYNFSAGKVSPDFKSLLRQLNLWFFLPLILIFLMVAKLTWLQSSPPFGYDPFALIRDAGVAKTFFPTGHFYYLGSFCWIFLASLAIYLLLFAGLSARKKPVDDSLLMPALLLLLILGISLFLAYMSYHRSYWILTRQWVASSVIAIIAVVWFLDALGRMRFPHAHYFSHALAFAILVFSCPEFNRIRKDKTPDERAFLAWITSPPPVNAKELISEETIVPHDNTGWVALANRNIKAGGAVWPVFRLYYGLPN